MQRQLLLAVFISFFLPLSNTCAQEGGQALFLDNIDYTEGGDFVYFPEHDFGFTDEITVAAWIRWETPPTNTITNPHEPTQNKWANLVTIDYHDDIDEGIFWLQHNSGNTKFEWAVRTGSSRKFIQSSTVPLQGIWYYLVGVFDGNPAEGNTSMRLYINGVQEASANTGQISGNLKSHNGRMRLNLGRIPSDYRLFNGQMDEVRIWKRALSREEIRKQMHSAHTVNTQDLVAYYPMNNTSGTTVYDSTGNQNGTFYTLLVDVHSTASNLCDAIPFSDFTTSSPWEIADADKHWDGYELSGLPTLTVSGAGVNQENAIVSHTCNTLELEFGWAGSGADTIATPVVDGDPYDTWLGVRDDLQTSQWWESTIPVTLDPVYIKTTTPVIVGESGASMQTFITSTPDSSNNVIAYIYGDVSEPAITGESFPTGIDARPDIIWGQTLFGSVTTSAIIDYSSISGISTPAAVTLMRRTDPDADWEAVPVSGLTHNTSNRTFTLTGTTSSYEYALGVNLSINPLPVELTGFTARWKEDGLILHWRTATELNSHAFEIQYRENGRAAWTTLATVPAAGLSNAPRDYSWTHRVLPTQEHRYRLLMRDRDGSFEYSSELIVNRSDVSTVSFEVYPNPASSRVAVSLSLESEQPVTLRVHDMLGRTCLETEPEYLQAGKSLLSLDVTQLRPGMYMLEVRTGNRRYHKTLRLISSP
ncbi:T9SS type A sorting domain-containing protein [bacterium]|nr:T9SS type A sorting domain-containing protein [bacterium]